MLVFQFYSQHKEIILKTFNANVILYAYKNFRYQVIISNFLIVKYINISYITRCVKLNIHVKDDVGE